MDAARRGLQPALDRHHYIDEESFRRETDMLRREWTCIGRVDDLGDRQSGGRHTPSVLLRVCSKSNALPHWVHDGTV